jgi:hypothetical protein
LKSLEKKDDSNINTVELNQFKIKKKSEDIKSDNMINTNDDNKN